ncbi:hypothetical protein HYX06_04395 [Candidatus Woesearchaeota archaeon]|nr:hypothetical protein [Candidatus Woesearchaeota archaeon]
MKKIFLFFAIFLIAPSVLADITILTEQDKYNLGNRVRASASVLQEADFEGLFKLTISCNDYQLQYYTTPVSLEANSRTAVDVPELAATSSMLGSCALGGVLTTNSNLLIEGKSSNSFEVTHQLKVLPVNSRITALPSESIKIAGVVNEAFGNNLLKADVKVSLDDSAYKTEAIDGKFDVLIELPKNIKSGKHSVDITASDSKNNMGTGAIELEITPVEKYLKLELSEQNIEPGKKIGITPYLYDQADDLMNASVSLEMTHENKEKMFAKTVQSNEKREYEFSQYAKPGNYIITGAYNNLQAKSLVNVTTIREVKLKYENQSVLIENVGNVPFIDEITLFVQNELKKYLVTKKLDIQPGKFLMVDLSKEVPGGVYSVAMPLKESIDSIRQALNQSKPPQNLLAAEVRIEDNRPIYKRIMSGIRSITGGLAGVDGLLTKNPLVAPFILASVILLLVIRYGRKPIMSLIKREKKEKDEKKD